MELCFDPCVLLFQWNFKLFGTVHALNPLLNVQEITLPMVLCTKNMLVAIKKFPAFLNAQYK